MNQEYQTVRKPANVELTIERSRFIGHCQEVTSEAEAKAFIAKIRSEYANATHNCYAYRIGTGDHPVEYYNDHGEPSGTAGKPILGAIQRLDLTNVVVVVTRYFGGKKLGVRGLIEVYGETTSLVLQTAGAVTRIPRFTATFTIPYNQQSMIEYNLKKLAVEIINTEFAELVTITVSVPEDHREAFEMMLQKL